MADNIEETDALAMPKVNTEEIRKLAEKLDKELDEFVEKQAKDAQERREKEGPSLEEQQSVAELLKELDTHPAFAKEIDWSKPLHPAMEGLISLKYDDIDEAEDTAQNYKQDGNQNFKLKKYRWAMDNYTEGIQAKCSNRELNAVLYTNRAAANFYLGNFRSSFNDVIVARKFKPDHLKAIIRGALCCMELKRYTDCKTWCCSGIALDENNKKLKELIAHAEKQKKMAERDRRKEEANKRKEHIEQQTLLSVIQDHGVKLADIKDVSDESVDPLLLSSLESHHPSGSKVHMDKDGILHWPVMFLHPEHAQTDFIENFNETNSLDDHLHHIFGIDSEPADWDTDKKYAADNIEVYFEDKDCDCLYKVDTSLCLAEILKHKRYLVQGGTPGFILLVTGSKFRDEFLKRYSFVS